MKTLLKKIYFKIKMLKRLYLLFSYFVTSSFSEKCYNINDIDPNLNLFTYKGKVYDATDYNHPGGKGDINKLVGNELSDFVNDKKYSFHLDSNRFYTHLDKMYVGDLLESCITTTGITTTGITTTGITTTGITTTGITTTGISTTGIPLPCDNKVVNSSNKLSFHLTTLSLVMILLLL